MLSLRSLPDIIKANLKVLAIEPKPFLIADHLTLAMYRNQGQLFACKRLPKD
jgi:hypothetical protein